MPDVDGRGVVTVGLEELLGLGLLGADVERPDDGADDVLPVGSGADEPGAGAWPDVWADVCVVSTALEDAVVPAPAGEPGPPAAALDRVFADEAQPPRAAASMPTANAEDALRTGSLLR